MELLLIDPTMRPRSATPGRDLTAKRLTQVTAKTVHVARIAPNLLSYQAM
jgi:hypothetical protein